MMADTRNYGAIATKAPTEGYRGWAIVGSRNYLANNFQIKLQLNLVYQPHINQPPTFQAPPYQALVLPAPGVSKPDFDNYVKANDAVMQNMQNQMANITDLITKFVNSNTASTSGSGSLPSNTIANPKGDVKAITTRSGVSYNGTSNFVLLLKRTENEPEVTNDTGQPRIENIQPPVVQTNDRIGEPVVVPKTKPTLPYPSRIMGWSIDYVPITRAPLILEDFLETARALIDEFTVAIPTSNFRPYDRFFFALPSFNPFGGMISNEEIDAFLEHDDSIPPGVDGIYNSEGDTVYLEE
ncbi:hypothetical protein Tco_0435410 [Tanacetum coccineum]